MKAVSGWMTSLVLVAVVLAVAGPAAVAVIEASLVPLLVIGGLVVVVRLIWFWTSL